MSTSGYNNIGWKINCRQSFNFEKYSYFYYRLRFVMGYKDKKKVCYDNLLLNYRYKKLLLTRVLYLKSCLNSYKPTPIFLGLDLHFIKATTKLWPLLP